MIHVFQTAVYIKKNNNNIYTTSKKFCKRVHFTKLDLITYL